jgi:hypothetical protein
MENVDTETVFRTASATKCAHAGCTCTVEAGERYCSDYCLAQVNDEPDKRAHHDECRCGHAECEPDLASRVESMAHGAAHQN